MRDNSRILSLLLMLLILSTTGMMNHSYSKLKKELIWPDPLSLDTMVTRITPVQQDYGVGSLHTLITNPPQCHLESEALETWIANLYGAQHFIWIIWDMTLIPQDAEVVGVEIEHELIPDPYYNSPGTRLQYRSLENTYLPPPDCWIAYDDLQASSVYLDVEMGISSGIRRYTLGDSATVDVARRAAERRYFSLWIISIA